MGLLTDSKQVRELMLSRNIYSATNEYNLDNDSISKVANAFGSIGIDIRSSKLIAGAERLQDNTKLGQIGLQRLAVEYGRRIAHNVFRKEVGDINIDNLLSKDKKVITKVEDFSITPDEKADNLISYLQRAAGYESQSLPTVAGKETNPEEAPGGLEYYKHLGEGQKAKLHEQLAMNNFNRYPNGGDPYAKLRAQPGRYTTNQDVYGKDFLDQRTTDNTYGTYIQEDNLNSNLNSKTGSIDNAVDAVSAGVRNMIQLESEGFGETFRADPEGYMIDADRMLQYNENGTDAVNEQFGAKRGIVHYTQQIAAGEGPIPNALRNETKEYGRGEQNVVVYRGSGPCRSFTFAKPLQYFYQGIRFEGNGNAESVVGESVIPNFFPRKPPVNPQDGVREPIMFSMENLAYSREDLLTVPASEKGPNEGRFMWFPPYGLSVTESYSADIASTNLLGRIEPIYTYNGVTRQMSVSFMLLIDTPPHVQQMKKEDMAAWFWGCINQPPPEDSIKPRDPYLPVPPLDIKTPEINTIPTRFPGPVMLKYLYQNDSDVVDMDYEFSVQGTMTGLNTRAFTPYIEPTLDYIHKCRMMNHRVYLTIEGRCSALATTDYNVRLSYRRATTFKNYILAAYNTKYGQNVLLANDIPLDQINNRISLGNLGQQIVIPSTDNTLEITIVGKGEKLAAGRGSRIREIDEVPTKNLRLAKITKFYSEPIKPVVPSLVTPTSPQAAQAQIIKNATNDAASGVTMTGTTQMEPLFNQTITADKAFPMGWDNVDYFASVFHSQTPYDLHKRVQFLKQLMYPGDTNEKINQIGSNSLFGRMPVCVMRIADWFHSKVFVNSLNFDLTESTWDTNPEGMGMQPMFLKVTMDVTVIGGMSLKSPINRLQTATDFNHVANSTFTSEPYYPKDRWDYVKADPGDPYRIADSRG